MNLIVIGINHKTAPVNVREKFSFTKKQMEESLAKLKESCLVSGAVILSTCNRTEIYIDLPAEESPDFSGVKSFVFDIYNTTEAERERYFYILERHEAIIHLFRVASGLNSQVLGEAQILGQVKSAWILAQQRETTSGLLDRLFEKAQEVGRITRIETGISQGNISIGSLAIDMLEERFDDLCERSVLIIGAGKIGALVSKYLKERNMRGIFVANKTYSKAVELANSCAGRAVDFLGLEKELKDVDIVISSTSSPHIILKKEAVAQIMQARVKPLFIMDLAVPRDVEASVKQIKGVSLCDLDDLQFIIEENHDKRKKEAELAEKIVQGEALKFFKLCFLTEYSRLPC